MSSDKHRLMRKLGSLFVVVLVCLGIGTSLIAQGGTGDPPIDARKKSVDTVREDARP